MTVKLIQKPDDSICTRISTGGNANIGYYVVFRGDKEDVIKTMETVLAALKDESTPVKQEVD